MIKKYYQSLLSVRYSFALITPALVIFFLAFRGRSKPDALYKYGIYFTTAVLLVVMFFYYRSKIRIYKGLKNIKDLEEYEKGGMLKDSYLLEDRILTIDKKFNIHEYPTTDINGILVTELKNGCARIECVKNTGDFSFEADSMLQAEHFAAYIKRRNPNAVIGGVKPAGKGFLKEFGAEYTPENRK